MDCALLVDGIRFVSTPTTTHHGICVDLLADGGIAPANRKDRPFNAKRSDVKKVLTAAAHNFEALVAPWEGIHGNA